MNIVNKGSPQKKKTSKFWTLSKSPRPPPPPPLVWTPKVWTPGRWSDPPPPPQKFGHQKFESIYTFGLLRRQSPNCSGVWEIRGFNQCNHNDFYHWDGTSVAFLCKKNKLFHTNFFGQGSLTLPQKSVQTFFKKVLVWLLTPPFWTMSEILNFF